MGELSAAVLTFGFICFATGILLLLVPKQRGSTFEQVVTNMVPAGGACTMLGTAGFLVASGLGAANWPGIAALLAVGIILLAKATEPIWHEGTRQRGEPTTRP
jgi:hypothetical protein